MIFLFFLEKRKEKILRSCFENEWASTDEEKTVISYYLEVIRSIVKRNVSTL